MIVPHSIMKVKTGQEGRIISKSWKTEYKDMFTFLLQMYTHRIREKL